MQKKKIDNYTIFLDKKLGEGSFGTVCLGEHETTKLKVAVKMLLKKTSILFITQSIKMIISKMLFTLKYKYSKLLRVKILSSVLKSWSLQTIITLFKSIVTKESSEDWWKEKGRSQKQRLLKYFRKFVMDLFVCSPKELFTGNLNLI